MNLEIKRNKCITGNMTDGNGCYCPLGWLAKAEGFEPKYYNNGQIYLALYEKYGRDWGTDVWCIYDNCGLSLEEKESKLIAHFKKKNIELSFVD